MLEVVCYTEQEMDDYRNRHARRLFDGIASQYDLLAEALSFLQFGRWRSFLVSLLETRPGDVVLDFCTGTAGVAIQVARNFGSKVVGVDISREMLLCGRQKVLKAALDEKVVLALGRAEELAFASASFDAVCFTYLLRYVEDPEATLREIVRVLKPGGRLASLEFALPESKIVRSLWYPYTRVVLPVVAGFVSPGWREVGAFLGPSISRFHQAYPVEQIQEMWSRSSVPNVRVRRLSLGGAVVMWGTKAAGEAISREDHIDVGSGSSERHR